LWIDCSASVCVVRQTFGCREYDSKEDQLILSQTNDTVVLRCAQNSMAARIWTLDCVDGRWMIPSDGRKVDCRSKGTAQAERPGDGSATDTGNQGTGNHQHLDSRCYIILIMGRLVYFCLDLKWDDRRQRSLQQYL